MYLLSISITIFTSSNAEYGWNNVNVLSRLRTSLLFLVLWSVGVYVFEQELSYVGTMKFNRFSNVRKSVHQSSLTFCLVYTDSRACYSSLINNFKKTMKNCKYLHNKIFNSLSQKTKKNDIALTTVSLSVCLSACILCCNFSTMTIKRNKISTTNSE